MSNFEIKRTITEEDIPTRGGHVKSKYEPIVTSCNTLETGEGIEVEIDRQKIATTVRDLLSRRHRRRHYEVSCRTRPHGIFMYIVRRQ